MSHERGLYLEDLHVGQRFISGTYQIEAPPMSIAGESDGHFHPAQPAGS